MTASRAKGQLLGWCSSCFREVLECAQIGAHPITSRALRCAREVIGCAREVLEYISSRLRRCWDVLFCVREGMLGGARCAAGVLGCVRMRFPEGDPMFPDVPGRYSGGARGA